MRAETGTQRDNISGTRKEETEGLFDGKLAEGRSEADCGGAKEEEIGVFSVLKYFSVNVVNPEE